ncbi:MAG: acyltransferase [Pseudomonadota bacterium]
MADQTQSTEAQTSVLSHTDRAHQAYLNQKFFGSLDGVRCVCILAVMWHHSPAYGSLSGASVFLTRGFTGVDFFFVLSGFLITTLLVREERARGRFSIAGFYKRRALRILPVYFLVVTAASLYFVYVKGNPELRPLIPYYYLFLSNFLKADIPLLSITWSLSVEEQYYVIWPLLLLATTIFRRMRFAVLLALILVCVAGSTGLIALPSPETRNAVWAPPVMSYEAILLGSLSALTLNSRLGYRLLYPILGWRGAPAGTFAILVLFLVYLPVDLTGWPFLAVHLAMTACVASLAIREGSIAEPILAFGPIARIGAISYGLYLYHLIGLHFANEFFSSFGPWPVTAAFVLISVAIAEVSFRTYEKFFISLKDKPLKAVLGG